MTFPALSKQRLLANFVTMYYHVCSDGHYAAVLFKSNEDYIAAMNRVAVLTLSDNVTVLAFVLMDNHFHFVLRCDCEENCYRFANEFKRLTGKYITDIYNETGSLRKLPVKVIPVEDSVYLKTLIGYVVKNPTQARLGMFYNYPWGSGGVYFRGCAQTESPGVTAGTLGPEAVRRICRTRVRLPHNWVIANGMILPENYVDSASVERLFKTSRSYMFFLSLNKDEDIEKDLGEWYDLQMIDRELRAARNELLKEMFGTVNIRDLSARDRLLVAKKLRLKFRCSKRQLARIVQLPSASLDNIL